MPAIQRDRSATDVRLLLAEAINFALTTGITVIASADAGVKCVSQHATERWVLDPRYRGVNPLGAAILKAQPERDHITTAALDALGVSLAWQQGFEIGVSGQPPLAGWMDHLARPFLVDGYTVGVEVRTVMAVATCELHGRRYPRIKGCPQCSENMTTPLDPDAGRAARG